MLTAWCWVFYGQGNEHDLECSRHTGTPSGEENVDCTELDANNIL